MIVSRPTSICQYHFSAVMTKCLQLEDTPEILLRPEYMDDITAMIHKQIRSYPNWKIVIVLNCIFEKTISMDGTEPVSYFLRSDTHQVNQFISVPEVFEDCIDEILFRIEDLRLSNSGR